MKSFTMEKTMPINLICFDELVNQIVVLRYELKFSLLTEAESPDNSDLIDAHLNQNVSFAKALVFVDQVLDHSICISPDNPHFDTILEKQWGNNIIVLPDTNESTFLSAVHSKLNAIVSDNTYVESLSLNDLTNNIKYYYLNEDDSYSELPSKDAWNPEFSYWDTPWWNRGDASTLDVVAENEEAYLLWLEKSKENNTKEQNYALFKDIEETITSAIDNIKNSGSNKGELIEVDFVSKAKKKWKPTLV